MPSITKFSKEASKAFRPKDTKTKALKDESYIDVEAREVKDKPKLTDSTMRADKRDIPDSKKGKRIAGAVGAATAAAAGTAYLASGNDKGTGKAATATKESDTKTTGTAGSTRTSAGSGRSAAGKEFDAKFAEMRRAGKDTFTWRGKTYNTRQAGETSEQHKAKMKKIRDKTEEEMQRITTTMAKGGMAKKKPVAKKPAPKKK